MQVMTDDSVHDQSIMPACEHAIFSVPAELSAD